METNMTTEMLFATLQKEKATGELVSLQRDFYIQARNFISLLNKGTPQEESRKQLDNANKILASLQERRRQKLLIYIAYNKSLPGLIPEEEESLYNEIRQILDKDHRTVRISKVKINSDIPEVLTTKGKKIGPYKQGEIVEVADTNDVDFIVKNKIGEIVA